MLGVQESLRDNGKCDLSVFQAFIVFFFLTGIKLILQFSMVFLINVKL
jgi:hypothetical protein